MRPTIRKYLSSIGRKGGLASRRNLPSESARKMVRVREARKAYSRFHPQCFWSYRPDLEITGEDVLWVAEQLMKHGGREAWLAGSKLCR